jgi:hypothetical protein
MNEDHRRDEVRTLHASLRIHVTAPLEELSERVRCSTGTSAPSDIMDKPSVKAPMRSPLGALKAGLP